MNNENAYTSVDPDISLDDVFTIREFRTVSSGETFSNEGNRYVIEHNHPLSLEKQQIELRHYPNGKFKVFYQGQELNWKLYELKRRAT